MAKNDFDCTTLTPEQRDARLALDVERLLRFGRKHKLIKELDELVARNTLLDLLQLAAPSETKPPKEDPATPAALLDEMVELAARKELFDGAVPQYRINFETRLMGALMPRESEVCKKFHKLYVKKGAKAATDWFYDFCVVTNYIRTAQIAKNIQWNTATPYGELEITINLTKPEKDPKTIALERLQPKSGYPACMLCKENIGYAGRINFPARQTHRIVPIELAGEQFYLQYSPYAYFHEHCIMLHEQHKPMEMNKQTLVEIFDFVSQFPHYTCGSNADLPIVGGSILSHDHFQGGHYTFAMERAPMEQEIAFPGYDDVAAGIVKWPMSVIRLRCKDPKRLADLADKILTTWRGYTDEEAVIYAQTGGEPHNTITPIARRRGADYELDLVLRNNLTTEEFPLGLYHPHPALHHIKKENIGLIEVMGLAVLPARLKGELQKLADALVRGGDLRADPDTEKHADWAEELMKAYTFTEANVMDILHDEVGKVFARVLECAGVYKCTPEGRKAFLKFIESVK